MDVCPLAWKPDVTMSLAHRTADVVSAYGQTAEPTRAVGCKTAVILTGNGLKEVNP